MGEGPAGRRSLLRSDVHAGVIGVVDCHRSGATNDGIGAAHRALGDWKSRS